MLDKCSKQLSYDELLIEAKEVSRTGGLQVTLIYFEVLWTKMINVIHEEPLDYIPLNLDAFYCWPIQRKNIRSRLRSCWKWYALGCGNSNENWERKHIWICSKKQGEFINGTHVRLYGLCQGIDHLDASNNPISDILFNNNHKISLTAIGLTLILLPLFIMSSLNCLN